jgi:hypothetical protein
MSDICHRCGACCWGVENGLCEDCRDYIKRQNSAGEVKEEFNPETIDRNEPELVYSFSTGESETKGVELSEEQENILEVIKSIEKDIDKLCNANVYSDFLINKNEVMKIIAKAKEAL